MNLGFWDNLQSRAQESGRGIFVLAPLANVTDPAFRRIIAKYGKPDAMWTEFVSADGLALAPEEGRRKLLKDLEYTEGERPILAQFFTSNPEHMEQAARLALELGFDGVDINMGCPDRSVEKQGAGAALVKKPEIARALIRSAKIGAESAGRRIPVSVKIRLGYNKDELESWLPELLAEDPAVITIHARTRKEMSKVPARWERVKRAVEIRDTSGKKTLIFGNGDVSDLNDAMEKVSETGCDGVMFGRAIFGNPWLFSPLGGSQHLSSKKSSDIPAEHGQTFLQKGVTPSTEERLKVLVEHTKLFEELLGSPPAGGKSFAIMKKHFKAYVSSHQDEVGLLGVKELRQELMDTNNSHEVEVIINKFLKNLT